MAHLSFNARDTGSANIVLNTPEVDGGTIDLIIPLVTSDNGFNLLPSEEGASLGSPEKPWENLYVKNVTVDFDSANIVDQVYPIGTIYLCIPSVDPNTAIGGKWKKISDSPYSTWQRTA